MADGNRTVGGLERSIEMRAASVGVVGLGYVGLPLAIEFAKAGFHVTGIDESPRRVDSVNQGLSHIDDICEDDVRAAVTGGHLRATTDWDVVRGLDAVVICVPTPFNRNKEPDLSHVVGATQHIAKRLDHEMLVVLESTTYPGTTDEVLLPTLAAGGLRVGRDFFLAFSPERIDPGNAVHHVANTPKIVGGITPRCTALASLLYRSIDVKVVPVSSPKTAEMAKLLENIFRNVNIALVNELAMLADRMNINIWEVIDAAATKPFGFMSFQPGPGVGGHCIPVDPVYLAWKAKEYDFFTNFINLAAEVNANMPYWVVQKFGRALARRGVSLRGARILVLGVTFKRDVADVRNSSALKLIECLTADGAEVTVHDPLVRRVRVRDIDYQSVALTAEALASADCVLVHTDHSQFDYAWIVEHARIVLDTRNATRAVTAGRDKIITL